MRERSPGEGSENSEPGLKNQRLEHDDTQNSFDRVQTFPEPGWEGKGIEMETENWSGPPEREHHREWEGEAHGTYEYGGGFPPETGAHVPQGIAENDFGGRLDFVEGVLWGESKRLEDKMDHIWRLTDNNPLWDEINGLHATLEQVLIDIGPESELSKRAEERAFNATRQGVNEIISEVGVGLDHMTDRNIKFENKISQLVDAELVRLSHTVDIEIQRKLETRGMVTPEEISRHVENLEKELAARTTKKIQEHFEQHPKKFCPQELSSFFRC